MTINSAADHGYTTEPPRRTISIGDTFRLRCALGTYELRVLRTARCDVDYLECVFTQWVTEVPAFRQGFVGSHETHSRTKALAAKYAD